MPEGELQLLLWLLLLLPLCCQGEGRCWHGVAGAGEL